MKKTRKKTSESRGTDDPFYKLMYAGGAALLKLIGISKESLLNELFRKSLRCQTLDEFSKDLVQTETS